MSQFALHWIRMFDVNGKDFVGWYKIAGNSF